MNSELGTNRILETTRLTLSEFSTNDTDFIIQLLNSPGWLRFIGKRNITTVTDADNYIETVLKKSYRELGFGFWRIDLKSPVKPIGMCGLIKREYLEYVDLGFALMPNYFGLGYAFEASRAVMTYAKKELGLEKLLATTDPENQSSIKLLHKLGFTFLNTGRHPDGDIVSCYMHGHTD